MLTEAEVLAEFEAAEAILRGHFILSSGLHSDTYLQCARVLMNPKRAEKLCASLATKTKNAIGGTPIDIVVAPAMGGVIVGYEMGRQLGVDTIFCERENGQFTLRRGFAIPEGARVLLVEDVVTTGKSSLETVVCIEAQGGKVVAAKYFFAAALFCAACNRFEEMLACSSEFVALPMSPDVESLLSELPFSNCDSVSAPPEPPCSRLSTAEDSPRFLNCAALDCLAGITEV